MVRKPLPASIMNCDDDLSDVDCYYIDSNKANKKYDEYITEINRLQLLIEKKEKELLGIIKVEDLD